MRFLFFIFFLMLVILDYFAVPYLWTMFQMFFASSSIDAKLIGVFFLLLGVVAVFATLFALKMAFSKK